MVAKKSESDKYVRVAFTMEPELHSSVIEKIKAEKATLSGVISSLLYQWALGGSIPIHDESIAAPSVDVPSFDVMMNRIKALEDTVSTLMSTDINQCAPVKIIPDGPAIPISENQIPQSITQEEEITVALEGEDTERGDPNERIILTDEIRKALTKRIKATGKTNPELVKITGVNESALKKIVNTNSPAKTLTRKDYLAIMSL